MQKRIGFGAYQIGRIICFQGSGQPAFYQTYSSTSNYNLNVYSSRYQSPSRLLLLSTAASRYSPFANEPFQYAAESLEFYGKPCKLRIELFLLASLVQKHNYLIVKSIFFSNCAKHGTSSHFFNNFVNTRR